MEIFDFVILGAGLGGLSAAACLTKQGYRVAVLEKHYLPGGCCHTFNKRCTKVIGGASSLVEFGKISYAK